MKYFFWTSILFAFFAFSNRAIAHEWKVLQNGLSYSKISQNHLGTQHNLHALKINPQIFEIKPIYTPARSFVKSMALSHDALTVINANFFDPSGQPLGLVAVNKTIVHPFKNISWWSVLCITSKSVSIKHSSVYESEECESAIQAGPRLVVQGNIPELKENISKKTAAGINTKNELIFVVSEDNVPVSIFAEWLRSKETSGGLEIKDAINLDGGSSTQMYVNSNDFVLDLPNFVPVPVGLGVFAK